MGRTKIVLNLEGKTPEYRNNLRHKIQKPFNERIGDIIINNPEEGRYLGRQLANIGRALVDGDKDAACEAVRRYRCRR